ncbi:MAG: hypothetical protein ACE3JK_16535 [Sporolactobacillus sp.]
MREASKKASGAKNVTEYYPGKPGPLDVDVAETFTGGTYKEIILQEDTEMFRVSGGEAGEVGRYLSKTPQNGGMQSAGIPFSPLLSHIQ